MVQTTQTTKTQTKTAEEQAKVSKEMRAQVRVQQQQQKKQESRQSHVGKERREDTTIQDRFNARSQQSNTATAGRLLRSGTAQPTQGSVARDAEAVVKAASLVRAASTKTAGASKPKLALVKNSSSRKEEQSVQQQSLASLMNQMATALMRNPTSRDENLLVDLLLPTEISGEIGNLRDGESLAAIFHNAIVSEMATEVAKIRLDAVVKRAVSKIMELLIERNLWDESQGTQAGKLVRNFEIKQRAAKYRSR